MPISGRTSQRWLVAYTAVGLLTVIGLIWAISGGGSPEPAKAPANAPTVAISAPTASPPEPLVFPQENSSTGAVETSVSAATNRVLDGETPTRVQRKSRSESPSPTSAEPKSSKARSSAARPILTVEPTERTPVMVSAPDPIAKRRLEEGNDLTFVRRARVQIDSESPYR